MSQPTSIKRITKTLVSRSFNIVAADIDLATEYLILGGYCTDPNTGQTAFFDCRELIDYYKRITGNEQALMNIGYAMQVMPSYAVNNGTTIATGTSLDFQKVSGMNFTPTQVTLDVLVFT